MLWVRGGQERGPSRECSSSIPVSRGFKDKGLVSSVTVVGLELSK